MRSQLRRIAACILTSGTQPPTWNLEINKRSNAIFTVNLIELITSGTSGLSRARVAFDTATSMAELKAEKALIRTYVMLASRISWGTNASVNLFAAATNAILMTNPRNDWKTTRVCASPNRSLNGLASLSAMVTHTARGRPSFSTSATVPIYV